MVAEVKALGYVVVETVDLDAWQAFACDFLGLMAAERTDDRLLLRMDEYAYRLDIRKGENEGITAMGWDVGTAASLAEIEARLSAAGYVTSHANADELRERMVSGLVSFRDPDDNFDIELIWGQANATPSFVSPTGATFVTGELGLGHAFQAVSDVPTYAALFFDILGFKLSDHIDFPNGVEGVFTHCNPRHHSIAFANLGGFTGIGHLMFQLDDIRTVGRAYDRVVAGEYGMYRSLGQHTNDKMISFYAVSPSGFAIEYGIGGVEIDDDVWRPTRYDAAHYWGHESSRKSN